jgi:hypothetical protein
MSRTGGQVTFPRKTSYTAYTSSNQRTTFHPLLRDHHLSSLFTQNYACNYFLILLHGQSWINIKPFTPYTSVQFATSYAAGQPQDAFLPSFHRRQRLLQCMYCITATAARGLMLPSALNRALCSEARAIFIPGSILTNSERERERNWEREKQTERERPETFRASRQYTGRCQLRLSHRYCLWLKSSRSWRRVLPKILFEPADYKCMALWNIRNYSPVDMA